MNEINKMLLGGMRIEILPERKVQVKTHRIRLINWIFKKLYGYKPEYMLDENTPAVVVGDTIYLRNKGVYEALKESFSERNTGDCGVYKEYTRQVVRAEVEHETI